MTSELEAAMQRRAIPRDASLEKVRDLIKEKRDADAKVADLEEQLKLARQRIYAIERVELPDLFATIGITNLSIPAAGNLPAYEAKLEPYYKAGIAASWSSERKEAAFAALERLGLSGIIKNLVSVQFNRGERDKAERMVNDLADQGISADLAQSVHWRTLTAAIKELCETNRTPRLADLDCLGADVGRMVNLKEKS